MFIDKVENLHFSPVGTICLSFYVVPTELKREQTTFFYKHIVPTGLKYRIIQIKILKLTLMVRLGNRTIGANLVNSCGIFKMFQCCVST
ncbi:MAG: hypothetical protein OXI43_02595, partial [Candidatus Poribacteria bacterium]|nr:hypothetical protein [Candidatus Poribacteria bacterium]